MRVLFDVSVGSHWLTEREKQERAAFGMRVDCFPDFTGATFHEVTIECKNQDDMFTSLKQEMEKRSWLPYHILYWTFLDDHRP